MIIWSMKMKSKEICLIDNLVSLEVVQVSGKKVEPNTEIIIQSTGFEKHQKIKKDKY